MALRGTARLLKQFIPDPGCPTQTILRHIQVKAQPLTVGQVDLCRPSRPISPSPRLPISRHTATAPPPTPPPPPLLAPWQHTCVAKQLHTSHPLADKVRGMRGVKSQLQLAATAFRGGCAHSLLGMGVEGGGGQGGKERARSGEEGNGREDCGRAAVP